LKDLTFNKQGSGGNEKLSKRRSSSGNKHAGHDVAKIRRRRRKREQDGIKELFLKKNEIFFTQKNT
jgi:hypothetical protein